MLHSKYKSASPYGLGQEELIGFSFDCYENQFSMEFKSLKYAESVFRKDHIYEFSLKSVCQFQRRCLCNCLWTDGRADPRTMDIWLILIADPELYWLTLKMTSALALNLFLSKLLSIGKESNPAKMMVIVGESVKSLNVVRQLDEPLSPWPLTFWNEPSNGTSTHCHLVKS